MYALNKETITKIKRAFKNRSPNPFEFDEVNNPPKKVKLFSKPKHPENLWIDVYKDLKIKTSLAAWMKEEGLSITTSDSKRSSLSQLLSSLDMHWKHNILSRLKELYICLPTKLLHWYGWIIDFQDSFDTFTVNVMFIDHDDKDDWTKFNEYNETIHNYCYDFHWNVNMDDYVSSEGELEGYKLISNYLSSFILMMDRITVVKNFLICCEENKKGYIINNVSKKEEVNKVLTESVLKMKSVNGKNRTERMINKPLKYMGLVVKDSSSNKHMYAEIESGDFNKYAYFQVVEEPRKFVQTLPSGKKIDKLVFHIDNFDDGKGHDAIFVPAWMSLELVNGDVSEPCGYLVAFERNQWNIEIIKKLEALNDGCDSVITLDKDSIQGLEYHY